MEPWWCRTLPTVLIDYIHENRRIFTDGRDFPSDMADNPQFKGYSIGRLGR
jgi:hypothetical protein